MYIPGQKGGFEIGVQENDFNEFFKRLARQRKEWNLPADDVRIQSSDLEEVIAGGTPPMFGFALNPDRIIKIWRNDVSIDPYQEF